MAGSLLQRFVALTTMLNEKGERGWLALPLAERLGYGGADEGKRESLARDIRHLRRSGLDIENVAPDGEEARWVLRPRDSRIRVSFTPEELAELSRAAALAGDQKIMEAIWGRSSPSGDVDGAPHVQVGHLEVEFGKVVRAVAARCRLRLHYNGKDREVSPWAVTSADEGWLLSGFDHTSSGPRNFAVARMSRVSVDLPGTAEPSAVTSRPRLDPLTWLVDEPVVAQLSVPPEFREDVRSLLGDGVRPVGDDPGTGELLMAGEVTNRMVFLARVVELGRRVRLLGPQSLRDELLARYLAPQGAAGSPGGR